MADITERAPAPQYDWQTPKPPFSMGTVLGGAFGNVFGQSGRIGLGLLIIAGIGLLLSLPAGLLSAGSGGLEVSEGALALSGLSVLIAYLSWMTVCVFTDYAVWNRTLGRAPGVMELLRRALIYTIPVLVLNVLLLIMTYAGFFLFVVPGIIISVGFCLVGPAFLHEPDTSFFGAFGRSWSLTKGYKGWVWLAQIVMSFVMTFGLLLLVGLSVGSVAALGLESPDGAGGSDPSTLGLMLFAAVSSLLLYLLLALYASFTTTLYAHLRELKEGRPAEVMAEVFS